MAGSPAPPYEYTAEGMLKAHGIPITRKAVFAVLAGKDATLRSLAAEVAINRWPREAIRPVERAMLKENVVWNKIGMASDLFALGDPLGRETLINVCHDMTVPGSARMGAAHDLAQFKDDSCLDSVFNTLQSATDLRDTVAKEDALEFAPELIRHFGPQQYQTVLQLVIGALHDPWPGVRGNASRILAQIGDSAAIPSLTSAIAKEKNDDTRVWMTRSLHDLRSKSRIQ